jgi:hypothetical protein
VNATRVYGSARGRDIVFEPAGVQITLLRACVYDAPEGTDSALNVQYVTTIQFFSMKVAPSRRVANLEELLDENEFDKLFR